jgi:hypothetical protein
MSDASQSTVKRVPFATFEEFQHELTEVVMRAMNLHLDHVEQELTSWAMQVREWSDGR